MGILALLFISIANLFAQANTDTTKKDSIALHIEHKPYEIFEYRGYHFTSGIRTTTLSNNLLTNNGAMSSLSDALQTMGGVYMRSYGGNMNNAITLRGFGPERTSVLWNGIAINNAGLGQLDMNLMPGGFFNLVQLIEGSSSTQYGNGAQGGSLLLEYKPDFENKFNIKLQQEYGSFFAWNTAAQLNYGNKWVQGRSAFTRNSANNNYPYKDKTTIGFPIRETVNANFFSYQAMQEIYFKLKKSWHLSAHAWYTYTDRKIPPAMGAANNNSRQFDQNIRVMTQLRKSFAKHDLQIQIAYINDQLTYHTDAFKDSSNIHSGQLQLQYVYHPGKWFTFMSGGNFSINYSEYKYYAQPIFDIRGNIFALIKYEVAKQKTNEPGQGRYTQISAGVRQQFSSHYAAYPSAHMGIDHQIQVKEKHRLNISGAVNSAYRMPTLNDLYWVPGGNPNLLPEYSWNIEHAYKYTFKTEKLTLIFDALGYFGRTSNWIQWTPVSAGYWTPQNITSIQSAGFETGSSFQLTTNRWQLGLGVKYNFTHTTDVNNYFRQLIYVPQHSIKGTMEVKWKALYLNLQPMFYSKRFTLSDNTQFIPSCFLLNLQAGYTLRLKPCTLGFYARLNNVTNADYQMVLNRPMPGINWNVGINFYLNTPVKKQNNK
jgi:iron complex outermembrane receptor protein